MNQSFSQTQIDGRMIEVQNQCLITGDRLTRAGYVCKTYVEPRQEQKSVMDIMEEQSGVAVTPLSYQAFDIKA